MIKLLRIDERLIHGQVAGMWCSSLSIQRIIVVNDEVVKDEFRKMALKMASPASVKTAIMNMEDALCTLRDPRLEKFSTMILVTTPQDALEIVKHIDNINAVNLGNIGLSDNADKKQLSSSVFVSETEEKTLREIVNILPDSYYQMTPSNAPIKLSTLLK